MYNRGCQSSLVFIWSNQFHGSFWLMDWQLATIIFNSMVLMNEKYGATKSVILNKNISND